MKNTVIIPNEKRKNVIMFAIVAIFCLIMMIIFILCIRSISAHNTNGSVVEVTGVVTSYEQGETPDITVNGHCYNTNVVKDRFDEFENLIGKTVTLIVPQTPYGSGSVWILGLKIDGETIVDYNEVLEEKNAENKIIYTVAGIIAGVFALTAIALTVWSANIPKNKETDLGKHIADGASARKINSKERKTITVISFVSLAVFLITYITMIIVAGVKDLDNNHPVYIALFVISCVFCLTALIIVIPVGKWLYKKELDIYIDKIPLDSSDVSGLAISKYAKRQLSEMIEEEKRMFPNVLRDLGNGCDAEFNEKGVKLLSRDEPFDDIPSAQDVFGENTYPSGTKCIAEISYEELNLIAVPYYYKKACVVPMVIVISSRLGDGFPDSELLQNDLHFVLDSEALEIIRKFGVSAENLDYLLENKKSLIYENCLNAKK